MESYAVVGGGLAGLTAANALADAGVPVTLFEQSERLGGRAITQEIHQDGRSYQMNLGPHALYCGGVAMQTLREWNIPFSGSRPDVRSGACMIHGGEKYPFFANLTGLMRNPLFTFREKLELTRILRLATTPQEPEEPSMEQWIMRHARSERVAAYVRAATRVSTYAADFENLSAGHALAQIRSALTRGVLYLDGGWQTLVNGLAERARSRGVEIRNRQPIESLNELGASRVILAIPPAAVERITGVKLPGLRTSRMACLQMGLRGLKEDAAGFALGLDQPLYLSVHSRSAKIASRDAAVVHAGKYLKEGEGNDVRNRAELEAFADLSIPGWRDQADVVQFLPNMIVTHGMAACAGRPEVDAVGKKLGSNHVAIAGDWVGNDSMLADAAVSSGLRAAGAIQMRQAHVAA